MPLVLGPICPSVNRMSPFLTYQNALSVLTRSHSNFYKFIYVPNCNRLQDQTGPIRTEQNRTGPDRTKQDWTKQDWTGLDENGLKTRPGQNLYRTGTGPRQNMYRTGTGHEQDKTRPDKTGQDRTRPDKTGQDQTGPGQDRTRQVISQIM